MEKKEQLIDELIDIIREQLHSLDNEIDLIPNDFGFTSAWLEDECPFWEYEANHVHMSEVVELMALHDVINDTISANTPTTF